MKIKLLADYLWTFGTSLVLNILQLFLVRVLAEFLPKDIFGAYLLIKKITSFAIPVITMNLGQGLSKFILLTPTFRKLFISISIFTLSGITILSSIIVVPFLSEITQRLFGNEKYWSLTICILLLSFSSALVAIVTDTMRGLDKIADSNKFQINCMLISVVTVVVFITIENDLIALVSYLGLMSVFFILISILYMFRAFISGTSIESDRAATSDTVRSFLHFSISRLPNQFIFNFIFSFPLLLASNTGDLELVAEVGVLLTIVRVFDLLIYPLTFNLVPWISDRMKSDTARELPKSIDVINFVVVCCLPFLAVCSYGMGDVLMRLLAGSKFMHLGSIADWFFPCYFLYLILYAVRAHLDTMVTRPVLNYIGAAGAVSLAIAMSVLGYESLSKILIALTFCFAIIGACSYVIFARKFNASALEKKFVLPQIVTLLSLLFLIYLDSILFSFPNFFGLIAIELFLRLILCGIFILSIKPVIFPKKAA